MLLMRLSTEIAQTVTCIFIELKVEKDIQIQKGAQWLSGRVLDWRPKGRVFEPYWRHCVVVLEQDTFILA